MIIYFKTNRKNKIKLTYATVSLSKYQYVLFVYPKKKKRFFIPLFIGPISTNPREPFACPKVQIWRNQRFFLIKVTQRFKHVASKQILPRNCVPQATGPPRRDQKYNENKIYSNESHHRKGRIYSVGTISHLLLRNMV